jgi:UDP-glucose 4-epimerase
VSQASIFKVEIAERRPGDPARVVADCRTAQATIGWQPRFDNLSTIVAHTLALEQKLRGARRAC